MHPNASLEAATELVHRILRFEHPTDRVVAEFFRESRSLGARERHALAETAYAVLRKLPLYRHLAQSGSGETERRLAILGWQGNAGFLRAALSDAEIEHYLRTEQPYDCAGSAKAETLGIALLDAIDSDDPTALIGLPLIRTCALLRRAGIDPLAPS